MSGYRAYLFDLDGTIYRGAEVLDGAVEVVRELVNRGSAVRFLTNNSAVSREQVCGKLRGMGVLCEPEWVLSSGYLAGRYCVERGFESVFVVGEPGLRDVLESFGLSVVERGADVVVAGICRKFDYDWMNAALQEILNGAAFVATNPDTTFPVEGGGFQPGAGAVWAGIRASSGVDPVVMGKPSGMMVQSVLGELGFEKEDVLLIGDRLDTDIAEAREAGVGSWLVLTGVERSMPEGQMGSADLWGLLGG